MTNELQAVSVKEEFDQDTSILGDAMMNFLANAYPTYLVGDIENYHNLYEKNSSILLDTIHYFKICSCTIDKVDDLIEFLHEKMQKFYSAIYSLNTPIVFGIISYEGETNLVIGIQAKYDVEATKRIMEGLLSGIELREYQPNFLEHTEEKNYYGNMVGVPTRFLNEKPQTFDLSSTMKSLNGQNYTVLFLSKPIKRDEISNSISNLIQMKDACFAISKRNYSRQQSTGKTVNETKSNSDTKTNGMNVSGTAIGTGIGALVGSAVPGIGTIIGAGIGSLIGSSVSYNHSTSHTVNYSKSISDSITNGESIAVDIQNSYAIELMNYAEKTIERFKEGQTCGMWKTCVAYSTDTLVARNILTGCLSGEMAKPNPDILPLRTILLEKEHLKCGKQELILPYGILSDDTANHDNPLFGLINSSELGLLCNVPTENVPGFELKNGKHYPLMGMRATNQQGVVSLGHVCDGTRPIPAMEFQLTEDDLNKHTFVCGITGSGKTSTVKGILNRCQKPFLVIESVKKEYRNIKLDDQRKVEVYTLGKPEINCIRFNPFYIMPGVNPQMHIDYLKDLFNASFSFYGPMPYILEKCLHNIYTKKGWNLTLGYHRMLVNSNNLEDFFDSNYTKEKYKNLSHRFLFPTMKDLKEEIERYIEEEMDYEGEVAGNIKTAIKARLENLCNGPKGYMFNTNEYLDFHELLTQNSVFELEGLPDDSDKAFCVGLFIIFVNEYRQIAKEEAGNDEKGLQHLLVIEEAHRLLKNVDIERNSETMGNPKGKAVEHFTNMIAEMRSYGQGVIIAEQIPNKLAPDVIKNSSNKIIHRIVAADDQEVIANTIGMNRDDAIYLGMMQTGYAFCHKEGMSLPISVKIDYMKGNYVSDAMLYHRNMNHRMELIQLSMIRDVLDTYETDIYSVQLLNHILISGADTVRNALGIVKGALQLKLKINDVSLPLVTHMNQLLGSYLAERLIQLLTTGVYAPKELLNDEVVETIHAIVNTPIQKDLDLLKRQLTTYYMQSPREYAKRVICELVSLKYRNIEKAKNEIAKYFVLPTEVNFIYDVLKERLEVRQEL